MLKYLNKWFQLFELLNIYTTHLISREFGQHWYIDYSYAVIGIALAADHCSNTISMQRILLILFWCARVLTSYKASDPAKESISLDISTFLSMENMLDGPRMGELSDSIGLN